MPKKMKLISLMVDEKQWEEIHRISRRRGRTKSDTVRMMVDLGIDCHRDLEKVGLIPLVDFAYYVKLTVKERIKENSQGKQLNIF